MRVWVVVAAVCLVLVPALADARDEHRQYTNRQLCRRMTKQIAHYENTVLALAKERGNDLWAASTEAQIDRLKNQRADRCPEWGKKRTALQIARARAEQMRRMMVTAAKYAAKYFTGGLY
jgi:hypothetical protein